MLYEERTVYLLSLRAQQKIRVPLHLWLVTENLLLKPKSVHRSPQPPAPVLVNRGVIIYLAMEVSSRRSLGVNLALSWLRKRYLFESMGYKEGGRTLRNAER